MGREIVEPGYGGECECGLPRAEHGSAPHTPFGEGCQAAGIYRRVSSLIADAPPAFRGADITFSAAGWCGATTETATSEAERLAEEIAATCEERHGLLPPGPEVCDVCGREPDNHIGGPILHRAMDDKCEVGLWEDRAYALRRDLAPASIVSLRATPNGYEMDCASTVDSDNVTLQLVIE